MEDGRSSSALLRQPQRRWVICTSVLVVVLFVLQITEIGTFATVAMAGTTSTSPQTHRQNPYTIGEPIQALKLSRLQMLTANVGVGVAPIVTYSGGLVRGYLARTNDAGATWTVTGVFPIGIYPWTTAFLTPREGYAITSSSALFTRNAGQTWSKVATSASPLSINIRGDVVWIAVEECPHGAMSGPCDTHLDVYKVGDLAPTSTGAVPRDQPLLAQVGPTQGYAIGSGSFSGAVFYTTDAGVSWRAVKNPCENHQILGSSVSARAELFIYCERGPLNNPGPAVLFTSVNGGRDWREQSVAGSVGLYSAVGSTGRFLWGFDESATLWESGNGGRVLSPVSNVRYATNGYISTFGASEAFHIVTGRGIYRTMNGSRWKLLR
jgi:hypothetical protein